MDLKAEVGEAVKALRTQADKERKADRKRFMWHLVDLLQHLFRMTELDRVARCNWCGVQFPQNPPTAEQARQHTLACVHHPMRQELEKAKAEASKLRGDVRMLSEECAAAREILLPKVGARYSLARDMVNHAVINLPLIPKPVMDVRVSPESLAPFEHMFRTVMGDQPVSIRPVRGTFTGPDTFTAPPPGKTFMGCKVHVNGDSADLVFIGWDSQGFPLVHYLGKPHRLRIGAMRFKAKTEGRHVVVQTEADVTLEPAGGVAVYSIRPPC